MLDKISVSQLAKSSKLSKQYISQVKSGKRPASKKLLTILEESFQPKKIKVDYVRLFLCSRESMGCTNKTIAFYRSILIRYEASMDYTRANRTRVERFLNSIPYSNNNLGNRHAYFRTLRVFHKWLNSEYGINNPMIGIPAPRLSKLVLPSLSVEQVETLINCVDSIRDKSIIALLTESGLRVSELAAIRLDDINWESIRVLGKGRKESYAPFGELAKYYLQDWLSMYQPLDNIWGITKWGIILMLKSLKKKTGLPCNPHTFRRTFACLLRKAGVDTMTIKDLGRWESLEMVQRYTRSVTFQDSMKFYKAPLGESQE